MANQRQAVVWIDAGSRTRQTVFVANATGSTIRAALLAHSNADFQDWFEGPDNFNLAPSPVSAAYPDVSDFAVLQFQDAGGNIAGLTLPAPKSSIFKADGVTVDASAIADVILAATTYLVNSAGNTVVAFTGGVRKGRTSAG